MALACQRDSYLKELRSRVKSINKCSMKISKKEKLEGFEILLDDTILFPEGGGQPDDRGTIDGFQVTRVRREGAEAIHFVPALSLPFEIGSEVQLVVDWERRFDHMTQHSGQHLITAVADKSLGAPTTSWNLGEKISTIELDTPSLSADQMQQLENEVNEKIRAGLPVYPTLYPSKEALETKENEGLRQAARGLPDDHTGPLRVVTISGVEKNMCCGTHVANTSHLQAIKLLGTEKGKKGKTNLFFVAAGRLLKYLHGCLENEKALTGLLKGGPESHVDLVDKLQKNFKNNSKALTNVSREMASKEVENVIANPPESGFLSYHTKGDNECMNIIVNGLESIPIVVFLTNGDEMKEGNFVLSFPESSPGHEERGEIASQIMKLLDAKGFGKNNRWQGKVMKMGNRDAAESLISTWAAKHLVIKGDVIEQIHVPASTDEVINEDYPPLTLFTYPDNPRAFKGLICARYCGISLTLADRAPAFIYGVTDKSPDFLAKFPSGKVPALEIHGQGYHLNESNAIADYLSSNHLKGRTNHQRAQNNQWIQFSTHQLVPPSSVWVYHVLDIISTTEENVNKAKVELEKNLRILDDHLLLNTYLVQEHVSNCDIVLFCDLLLAFQQVFDDAFLRNFVNLKRWFKTIANQENIASVIGGHKSLAKF